MGKYILWTFIMCSILLVIQAVTLGLIAWILSILKPFDKKRRKKCVHEGYWYWWTWCFKRCNWFLITLRGVTFISFFLFFSKRHLFLVVHHEQVFESLWSRMVVVGTSKSRNRIRKKTGMYVRKNQISNMGMQNMCVWNSIGFAWSLPALHQTYQTTNGRPISIHSVRNCSKNAWESFVFGTRKGGRPIYLFKMFWTLHVSSWKQTLLRSVCVCQRELNKQNQTDLSRKATQTRQWTFCPREEKRV